MMQVYNVVAAQMHPVQAAPRQRHVTTRTTQASRDAPRAGSAEAKAKDELSVVAYLRCTPCRQRRGKVKGLTGRRGKGGCTPCRQRRGKELCRQLDIGVCAMHPVQAAPRQRQRRRSCSTNRRDAPRAGSAEAKTTSQIVFHKSPRCTPCRQRRGKDLRLALIDVHGSDAPRAGSAEAKVRESGYCPSSI